MTFRFDDADWSRANQYIRVDEEGRRAIENIVSLYRRFVEAGIGRPMDRRVRQEITKVSRCVEELFQALQDLSIQARAKLAQTPVSTTYVFPERFGGTPLKDGLDLLSTRIDQLDALKIWVSLAIDDYPIQNGQDVENFRWMIQNIGDVVEQRSPHKFNRGKICFDFVREIVGKIDSTKNNGQVEGAIKAYVPSGKSAP